MALLFLQHMNAQLACNVQIGLWRTQNVRSCLLGAASAPNCGRNELKRRVVFSFSSREEK